MREQSPKLVWLRPPKRRLAITLAHLDVFDLPLLLCAHAAIPLFGSTVTPLLLAGTAVTFGASVFYAYLKMRMADEAAPSGSSVRASADEARQCRSSADTAVSSAVSSGGVDAG